MSPVYSRRNRRMARRSRLAFTLVEMLVAITILALLIGLLLQISMTTFAATRLTHQKIEANTQARQVLDAVGNDCLGLITQNGTPLLAGFSQDSATSAYNTQFCLLTQSRGPSATTRCMAVSYLLDKGNLERLSQPVLWTSSLAPLQNVLGAVSGTTVSEMGIGILRFVAVASLSDGSMVPLFNQTAPAATPTLPAGTWALTTVQGQSTSPFVALNVTDTTVTRVRSITVAVAALDAVNYRLLSTANLSTITSSLISPAPDAIGNPPRCSTPVALWESAIAAGQLSSLPRPALAALQIVQTTYSLPQ